MDNYFERLMKEQRQLRAHGLSDNPTEGEILEFAMEVADKLSALYSAIGLMPVKSRCGEWHALPKEVM